MAKVAKIVIEVTTGRLTMTKKYRTNGQIAQLTANDVRNVMTDTSLLPTTGSKAFWSAVLEAVADDILAGNGGGT